MVIPVYGVSEGYSNHVMSPEVLAKKKIQAHQMFRGEGTLKAPRKTALRY